MFRIKTLNEISKIGLEHLGESYIYGDNVESPDGIIVRSFNMMKIQLDSSLLAISRAGSGTNNIPIEKCSEAGVVVFNTPGANSNAVKELVIAAIIISSRKVLEGIDWVKGLKCEEKEFLDIVESGKSKFSGSEINGKTLGVIGLGAIGLLVANASCDLGMKVLGYDPYISVDSAWKITNKVKKASSLSEIFEKSDYITIHVPYTESTKEILDATCFKKMKKGVRVLNFSRGELVNQKDIIQAIEDGLISCYVTDFGSEELLKTKNVIVMPHLGASTVESEDNCAVMASNQLRDFFENGNIKNSVNFPDCFIGKIDKVRITIIHKNTPNMINKITEKFSEISVNIDNMLNKSKGDNAYTMIDVNNISDYSIIENLKEIENIIKIRVIN